MGAVCIIAMMTVAIVTAFVVGYVCGDLDANTKRADLERETDHSDAWRRESERQRADALRWKQRALRAGWRWNYIDSWRARRAK